MATKSLKLVVSLIQIRYSGGNIGNDLTFGFDVNGEESFLSQKISAGKNKTVSKILWKSSATEGGKISFKINAVVTEQDLIVSDVGEGNTAFDFNVTPSEVYTHEFQVQVKEGKKTATFTLKLEAAIKDLDYSRFDQALKYMYEELTTNAQSKDVQSIKDALANGKTLQARTLWFSLVQTGAKWDHKPILEMNLGLANPPDYYFPLRNDAEHEWYYDIWSNIHFGFVGRAAGFSGKTLQDFAASGLPGTGKNDEGDVLSVQIGIDLWDEHQLSLTEEQLHEAIISHLQDYLDIQKANSDINVVIDWTDGNLR